MSEFNWVVIFRDAVAGMAGVVVYDKGSSDVIGRYVIAKSAKSGSRIFTSQAYRVQRPAAIRFAKKWLANRAKMDGVEYVPGDGEKTMAYKPVGVRGGAV